MKSLEYYKERFSEATEEGLRHEKGSIDWAEFIRSFSQKGKYNKVTSLIRLIKELAPGMVSENLLKIIPKDDPTNLPFNPDKLEFRGKIGKGGEHKVFLLEAKDSSQSSYVLKINHQVLGGLDQVKKKAARFKQEYEEIKDRYKDLPGIIPEELTIITPNLKTGKPAMATIQKFYGNQIRDLLKDFNQEELISLMGQEPKLYSEFKKFYEITEKQYCQNGVAVDLLGDKNLSIVKTDDGFKLIILDPHSSVYKASGDKRIKEQEIYMQGLKNILDRVSLSKIDS